MKKISHITMEKQNIHYDEKCESFLMMNDRSTLQFENQAQQCYPQ